MLKLTLVTPSKKVLDDAEVEEVFIPAYRGELNILPGHSALVTTLESGVLKYRLKGSEKLQSAAISWGHCDVFNDVVSVLAESAETASEIDREETLTSIREIQTHLDAADITPDQLDELGRKLKREQTRLELLDDNLNGASGSHS